MALVWFQKHTQFPGPGRTEKQVIDELEPVRRGPYCGAIGLISGEGSMQLNVAIRTIALSGRGEPKRPAEITGVLDYWTGCGIVAESDPVRL